MAARFFGTAGGFFSPSCPGLGGGPSSRLPACAAPAKAVRRAVRGVRPLAGAGSPAPLGSFRDRNHGNGGLPGDFRVSAWQDLLQIEKEIATGVRCHPDTEARVFSASHPNAPVTFYRDGSALCPDCQAVWLLLEAKEINYTVVKEDLRAHGRKSEEFLRKVPSGSLPAIEARGRWATNSLDAMFLLEHLYPNPLKPMFPSFSRLRLRALELLELHRALMNAWSTYMFREEWDGGGENSDTRWFLPYQHPSIVDIQYVCSMERIVASAMFFKAMDLREMFPRIDEWLGELEKLPWYRATKGDFYSHCMALAPRYGPAVPVMLQRSQRIRDQLMPANYPLPFRFERDMEALLESDRTQRLHHVEASWALLKNRDSLVRYMCRAAGGQLGLWARNRRDRSQLADPEAAVLEPLLLPLEVLLCTVAEVTFEEAKPEEVQLRLRDAAQAIPQLWPQLSLCLAYLRDRIGVPRDLPLPTAKLLRAYLAEPSGDGNLQPYDGEKYQRRYNEAVESFVLWHFAMTVFNLQVQAEGFGFMRADGIAGDVFFARAELPIELREEEKDQVMGKHMEFELKTMPDGKLRAKKLLALRRIGGHPRARGRVIKYHQDKGYGFIDCGWADNVFFMRSSLPKDQGPILRITAPRGALVAWGFPFWQR
eukprot:g1705.t1